MDRSRSPSLSILLFVAVVLVWVPFMAESRTRHYRWNVTYEYKSPDCYEKLVIAINGESPGPPIKAQQGDTIVVHVKNQLVAENLAIHWHGIRQTGTPWSDGAGGVTQCPILPGETFVYRFVVDRPGTYLYHGHYALQKSAGLYGSIQVAVADGVNEPFTYDGDLSIMVNDHWHKNAFEQAKGLSSIPYRFIGEPQSLLIEDRGYYNCSLVDESLKNSAGTGSICNSSNPECSVPHILSVVPGKTYRLRIGNAASLSLLNLLIEGHNMTVVEADGNYVEPVVVQNLDIHPGQTYSVLITADQNPSRNYWVAVNVRGRLPQTATAKAILKYISENNINLIPPSQPAMAPLWNDTAYSLSQSNQYKGKAGHAIPPPLTSDRRLILLTTQNKIDGHVRWAVNNVSLSLPATPYLIALKYNLTAAFDRSPAPEIYRRPYKIYHPPPNPNAEYGNSVYSLRLGSTVDVILQNSNGLEANKSETHPWHLHGHDFWLLAHGDGEFCPSKDAEKFNLVNPPLRNTAPVFPYGWTAIRFRADNPGVWMLHCHVEAHLFLGMSVVFVEGVESIGKLPASIMGCGRSKGLGTRP